MNQNFYKYYVVCILCFCTLFTLKNNIQNNAPLVIDSFEYHILGVNLSKGQGFNTMGIYGDLEDYKFNYGFNNDVTYPTSPLLFKIMLELKDVKYFFRDPGYSIFLGGIYSIFGINPVAVFYLQIFMLAASLITLPIIFNAFSGSSGFYASLVSGLLMFFYYKSYTLVYLTEVFQIFVLSMAILMVTKFKKPLLLFIASLLLGVSLLTKGSMYLLVPFIVLFAWNQIINKPFRSLILLTLATLLIPITWSVYANYQDKQNKHHQLTTYQEFSNSSLTHLTPKITDSSLNKYDKNRIISSNFDLQNQRDPTQIFFDEGIKLMLEEAFYAQNPFFIPRRFSNSLIDCNNEYLLDETNPHWIKWRLVKHNPYLNQLAEGKTQLEIIFNMIIFQPLIFSKIMVLKTLYFLKTFEKCS